MYLMRHGEAAYFEDDGRPVPPEQAGLTAHGREQALAAGRWLSPIRFDRVITSGLRRTIETARLVLSEMQNPPEIEQWPDLRELKGGRLRDIADAELEQAFLGAFRGVAPEHTRFLHGETIGSLFDRVLPALQRLLDDAAWDTVLLVLHGGVNCAVLSYALTGQRLFLGGLAQTPACINALDVGADWVVRAVNVSPTDWIHVRGRTTTMEDLLGQYLKYRRGTVNERA